MRTSGFFVIRLFAICLASILATGNVMAQPGEVSANGITIAYESFGDPFDETIIMIQGTGATMLHYPVELCEKLSADRFHVIQFDNRDIDPIVPLAAGQEVASTIPNAELCIIEGMGHDISLQFVPGIADCITKIASESQKLRQE